MVALVVGVVIIAIVWRLWNRSAGFAPPNVELVTSSAVILALTLGIRWKAAALGPLAVVIISDLILGNSQVYLFTWSAWLVIGIFAIVARRLIDRHRFLGGVGFALVSSTWFFLWTNFGVWALWRGTFYSVDASGLISCYAAGIPFYRNMLLANLALVPLSALLAGRLMDHRVCRHPHSHIRPHFNSRKQPLAHFSLDSGTI
ncbi:MAG: hypothetical protein FWH11_00645 [Micrococcales bacterium]|nr:hypothetical protein [Micrococcales bacterium]